MNPRLFQRRRLARSLLVVVIMASSVFLPKANAQVPAMSPGLSLPGNETTELAADLTNSPDAYVWTNAIEWKPIDLAAIVQLGTNRAVNGKLMRWLLNSEQQQIGHDGLHICNAIIRGGVYLQNMDIHSEVCFENCRFQTNVDLSGAHFSHNLSFLGCVFEGSFVADGLQLDGSLLLKPGNVASSQTNCFRQLVSLNGAVIGGKLDVQGGEFCGDVVCTGLKAGSDVLMTDSRFDGQASFGHIQTGHDFGISGGTFSGTDTSFDGNGMSVGGSLIIEKARFTAAAKFNEVTVGNSLLGRGVRFDGGTDEVDFSGMKVGGSAILDDAQFAGPVNFILAHIGGNLSCQSTSFKNAECFDQLNAMPDNISTFNADFGSLQVDGFGMFYQAHFERAVSFRNARFENLYLDGVQWPDKDDIRTNYTTYPTNGVLLRVEGLDFQAIRDLASANRFSHSKEELAESETNLITLLEQNSPYSYDIYAKLEDYFTREGEPDLADKVFVKAKERESRERDSWGDAVINFILKHTVDYGRNPWLAFRYSCICIALLIVLCYFCMVETEPREKPRLGIVMLMGIDKVMPYFVQDGKRQHWFPARHRIRKFLPGRPRVGVVVLYSIDKFLPNLVDLGTSDLMEVKPDRSWVRWLLATGRILGWILVPLWTVSIAGLLK